MRSQSSWGSWKRRWVPAKLVIPLLLGAKAHVPPTAGLPLELAGLAERQAFRLHLDEVMWPGDLQVLSDELVRWGLRRVSSARPVTPLPGGT